MKPIIVKRSTIYLIWVIPIIAIIISGIMLFNEYARMGESVVIIFKDARGFKQDETPIKYKGILIGTVKEIEVDPNDLSKFVITAKIKKSFVKYLTEGARFWKVSPKLKPTEFTGLSTFFSGTYIEFSPATSDPQKLNKLKSKRRFYGFEEEPKTNVTYFRLYGEDGSLIEGAPVLYKNFIVGNITKKALKGREIEYIISIGNKFASLVKTGSHFWKISPVDIKASLPDFQVKVNNVFNFFFGGIQFDSPEDSQSVCSLDKNSKEFAVCNKKGFYLFPSRGDTEYSLKKIKLVLKNAHKVQSSLKLVYYKGDVAGKVVSSYYDVAKDTRYLYVKMKRKYFIFLSYKSIFWIEKPDIENLNVQSIVKGTHIEFSFYNRKSQYKNQYTLYPSKPYNNVKHIILQSTEEVGLSKGDYLFYGKTVIGEVVSVRLKDGEEKYHCIIYREFSKLLKDNPVFYKKSGIQGSMSAAGIDFSVSPLKELFFGGVGLIKSKSKVKQNKNVFPLFKSRKEAECYVYLNGGGIKFSLLSDNLQGVYKGMPIYYRGMKIGKVYGIKFDKSKNIFMLKGFVEENFKVFVKANSIFYKSSGIDLKIGLGKFDIKTENIVSLLKGAIVLKNKDNKVLPAKDEYKLLSSEELERTDFVKATLISDSAYGLKEGSAVVYRGVNVGAVKSMQVKNNKVEITLLLNKEYAYLLDTNSRFYIEKTKVAGDEIKNLSSAVFGSSVKIAYFNSGKKATIFKLAGVNPSDTVYRKGFRIIIIVPQINSLVVGSPLLYNGVRIGEIENIMLSKGFKSVELTVFVEEKYESLIREDSVFQEVKPVKFKAGFIYAKVDFKSFSTILKGGLELINPGVGKCVEKWHKFYLKTYAAK